MSIGKHGGHLPAEDKKETSCGVLSLKEDEVNLHAKEGGGGGAAICKWEKLGGGCSGRPSWDL